LKGGMPLPPLRIWLRTLASVTGLPEAGILPFLKSPLRPGPAMVWLVVALWHAVQLSVKTFLPAAASATAAARPAGGAAKATHATSAAASVNIVLVPILSFLVVYSIRKGPALSAGPQSKGASSSPPPPSGRDSPRPWQRRAGPRAELRWRRCPQRSESAPWS